MPPALEENRTDLRRHADDFSRRAGFTFTVLDPSDNDVIGCVYMYPSVALRACGPLRTLSRAHAAARVIVAIFGNTEFGSDRS